jgi:hypothetical protein
MSGLMSADYQSRNGDTLPELQAAISIVRMPTQELFFKIRVLAALASCTLILAACGGSDSSQSSATPTTSSASTNSSTTPTAAPPSSTSTGTSPEVNLEISGSPPTTATAGAAYSFEPILVKGGQTVSYSITGKPDWATFNTTDGSLTGTPGVSDEGKSAVITISASSGSSTASLAPFTIQVNAPAAPTVGSATLTWGAPTTNENGTEITSLAGYHIYYGTDESSLKTMITISTPTVTTYVVNGLSPGTYYFAVVAYNSMGVDSSESNIARKTIS